jgi:hypothetical protein
MNAPERSRSLGDWTDANQRALVAEFARLKRLLARRGVEPAPVAGTAHEPDVVTSIASLTEAFGLSAFERDVLLLAAGVEMDSEIATLCAAAHGVEHKTWATFGLAMAVLPDPHWSALTPVRPLRRWQLLEVDEDAGLTQGRLRIDERVLHHLAGIGYLDRRLQPMLTPVAEPRLMADSQRALAGNIADALRQGGLPSLVQLWGTDAHGRRDVATAAAAQLHLPLHAIAAADIPANPVEIEALATIWQREASLLGTALLIECADAPGPNLGRFVERIDGLVFLGAPEPLPSARTELRYRVDKPTSTDQRRLWQQALGTDSAGDGQVLDRAAAEFRLSANELGRAARQVLSRTDGDDKLEASLARACRDLERSRLGGLAQRIEPAATWSDIVLPEAQVATLRQIGSHVRHRLTVFEHWGFGGHGTRGQGLAVLFAGESGTGKTMAAEVLADELQLELFRIDLSAVVSKYIGESEKNLARVFDAAEDSGAILLFDEADALFGKRSEVKDSHDRYANIEVSYLLQRMEAYRGLAILTTNQKSALDTAFHRRLRFVVNFPFPEAAEREAIWRRVFPAATPTDGLDHVKLARLQVAGGNIRNIALNAAFHAAEDGRPVTMAHLLRAAHAEAGKRDRPLSDAETRGWV